MSVVSAPRGTLDWLAPRVALRQRVVGVATEIFERAGFSQVVTPCFEDTALFARSSGADSDVVSKEMYSFRDRSDRELTLRPEGTAPVMRAFLEHGLAREPLPARLWYVAPMFRYSRPQEGRYREHWQFGAEAIGSADPALDAELIALQARWYAGLGLDGFRLRLNSIGDAACRPAYRDRLRAHLAAVSEQLSDDSRRRAQTNPLRVFDSKEPQDQAAMRDAPRITDALCDACAEHFAGVREHLDARHLAYEVDPSLVRGLDYYERTAWEFDDPQAGAQSAVSGGGRYDGLAEAIGGPRTPGIGFGCGIERLVLALQRAGAEPELPSCDLFVATDEPAARPLLMAEVDAARGYGLHAQADLAGRSLKGQLRHAGRLGARLLAVCEPGDWRAGSVRLGGDPIPVGRLAAEAAARLRRP